MEPDGNTGTIRTLVLGDPDHAAFDKVSFVDENTLLVGEDRGELLHTQRNALDSLWFFDITSSDPRGSAQRLIAEGRDQSATADRPFVFRTRAAGFPNDGDNEVTGVHTSLGLTTVAGLQGVPLTGAARTFYTAQHGDNTTYELTANQRGGPH